MFLHNVFFWLKEDLDDDAIAAFEEGVKSLCQIEQVKSGHYGTPADTHREVIDSSYSYGMVLVFDDKSAQHAYQVGDIHQRFVALHDSKWDRVVVYDIVVI